MSKRQSQSPLTLSRQFQVPRERIFKAWTNPEELRKWWLLGQGWRLSVVEVDLRVGGRYRIGLESTDKSQVHEVNGVFKRVSEPDKLVYTWNVKDADGKPEESLVTVEFRKKGPSLTELVLTHNRIGRESRQNTAEGWLMVLGGLEKLLGSKDDS